MKVFLLLLLSFSSVLGVDQTINIKTIYKSNFNNGKFEGLEQAFAGGQTDLDIPMFWQKNQLNYFTIKKV